MPLFDTYVMVDWSAAKKPVWNKDSIWIGAFRRAGSELHWLLLENPRTRAAATIRLSDFLAASLDRGERVLVGFDFPFGYSAGTCDGLGLKGLKWRHLWSLLSELLQDEADNRNNRFDVGATLNKRLSKGPFPFWGHDGRHEGPFLTARKHRQHGPADMPERRQCELRVPTAQSAFKLAYTGSVGSQALTGIPRVWEIRRDPRLAMTTHIWPFETGLAADESVSVVLAEVYPSLVPHEDLPDKPKDAGQVTAIAKHFAALDARDALAPLFAGDPALSEAEREAVVAEEAWILGVPGAAA